MLHPWKSPKDQASEAHMRALLGSEQRGWQPGPKKSAQGNGGARGISGRILWDARD